MKVCNYFKSLFKEFNPIHLIVLFIFTCGLYFLSTNVDFLMPNLANLERTEYTIKGIVVIVFSAITLCSLLNIKSKEISFFDIDAIVTFLAFGGCAIYSFIKKENNTYTIIITAIAAISFISVLLRIFICDIESKESRFKYYMSSLVSLINPLIFTSLGVVCATYVAYHFDFTSKIYSYINNYYYAITLSLVILSLLGVIIFNKKINLIDYLFIIINTFLASLLIYGTLNEGYPLYHIAILLIISVFSFYIRALSYEGKAYESNYKIDAYNSNTVLKYDYLAIVLYSIVSLVISIMPLVSATSLNSLIFKITGKNIDVTNYKLALYITGLVLTLLPVITSIITNKFKNKNIIITDYFIKSLEVISLLSIPYIYYVLRNYELMKDVYYIALTIMYIVIIIYTITISIIRVKHVDFNENTTKEAVLTGLDEVSSLLEEIESNEALSADKPLDLENEEEAVLSKDSTYDTSNDILKEESHNDILKEESQDSQPPKENIFEDETFDEEVIPNKTNEDEELEDDEQMDEDDELEENDLPDTISSEKRIRLTFVEKATLSSDEVKNYYNEVKNYLLMYRAHARMSKKCESFRYKGLLAKVGFAGKTLKVNLAIDPQTLEGTKYYYKDTSDKKQYKDVPTQIRIKSERGLRYFKELVDIMMNRKEVKAKRRFEPQDFTSNLYPDGHAVLYSLGVSNGYLVDTMDVSNVPYDLPIDLVRHIPTVSDSKIEGIKEENSIYLDTLCKNFEDGDTITLEILKEKKILTRGNMLRIKARGTIDKHFTIYADSFEASALAMLLCTGSTAIKIVRNK